MESSEIKQKSLKELKEQLDDESKMLTRMKLNHVVSPLDNPLKLQKIRRNIARMKTEIRQREIIEKQTS